MHIPLSVPRPQRTVTKQVVQYPAWQPSHFLYARLGRCRHQVGWWLTAWRSQRSLGPMYCTPGQWGHRSSPVGSSRLTKWSTLVRIATSLNDNLNTLERFNAIMTHEQNNTQQDTDFSKSSWTCQEHCWHFCRLSKLKADAEAWTQIQQGLRCPCDFVCLSWACCTRYPFYQLDALHNECT
jgi:hypothetical protein